MKPDQKKTTENSKEEQRPISNLPATEIAKNPNLVANENINEEMSQSNRKYKSDLSGVGSEITDREDG